MWKVGCVCAASETAHANSDKPRSHQAGPPRRRSTRPRSNTQPPFWPDITGSAAVRSTPPDTGFSHAVVLSGTAANRGIFLGVMKQTLLRLTLLVTLIAGAALPVRRSVERGVDPPLCPVPHRRQHLLGRQLRPGVVPDYDAAGKHPDQHRRRRHGAADQEERRTAGLQAIRHQDPHRDARTFRPRRRHGRTEAHDRRAASGVRAGKGAARNRRQGRFPVRRHPRRAVRAGKGRWNLQGWRVDLAGRDVARRASSSRPHERGDELHRRRTGGREDLPRHHREYGVDQSWRDGQRDEELSRASGRTTRGRFSRRRT